MKTRKPSSRKFLIGNFLPAYGSDRRRNDAPEPPRSNAVIDRLPAVRAERRAERQTQYTTNIEVGFVVALLIAVLALQLPIHGSNDSGWIQQRLAEQQTMQAEIPPRPTPVESANDVIWETEPIVLDNSLDLGIALADQEAPSDDQASNESAPSLR
jgi:hypothetical protein